MDFDRLQALNLVVHSSLEAAPPSTPVEGQLWYPTDVDTLKVYTGSLWNTLVVGPGVTTSGRIPSWNGTSGSALNDGYDVVTSVGNPGVDTAFVTEKGIRSAITSASGALISGTPADNQVAVWTNATTIEGTSGLTYDNDNILTVSGTSGSLLCSGTYEYGWTEPNLGAGVRMLWWSYSAAFRAGQVSGTQWDYANIGTRSFAVGQNTTASGTQSSAFGLSTIASGSNSFAANSNTTASGTQSSAFGFSSLSESYACFVIGKYNVGGGTVSSWVSTESVFEIGIGSGSGSRANAVTVLKDGTVKLSQTLKVNHIAEYTASHNIFFDNDIQTHSDDSNTILGVDSFKHYVSSQWSVGIGYQALHASTTGNFNVAIGATAGVGITTGTENTVIGNQCFCTASNATHNIAIGSGTMYNLTSGDYNVAIGNNALYALVDNDMNVAIGYHAAQFTSTFFSVTDCGNSIYIGANVHPLNATGDYNEIVIGYEAIGAGANTVVLGNTSITQTTLRGTVLTNATSTTRAGLRLPHGTAPTSPVNGDFWSTTAGFYGRVNGATVGPFGVGVSNTGTPVDNQIAVWTNATTIEGTTGLTYDGTTLSVTSNMYASSNVIAGTISGDHSLLTSTAIRIRNNTTTYLYMNPSVTDGATSIAYIFDTVNTLTTTGAKLFSLKNQGTEKFYVDKDGEAYANGVHLGAGGGVTPTDNILDWDAGNSWYAPYAAKGAGHFDSGTVAPTNTTRLNYDGYLYATAIHAEASGSDAVFGITSSGGYGVQGSYSGTSSTLAGVIGSSANAVGVVAYSGTDKALFIYTSGTVARSSDLFQITRTTSGSGNVSGDIISINDYPTTSGTISGSALVCYVDGTQRLKLGTRTIDGGSAIAYIFDTHNALTTTAKLVSFKNQGTEWVYIKSNGLLHIGTTNDSIEYSQYTIASYVGGAGPYLYLNPNVSDGSTAVGFLFGTTNSLSTAGAKLASFKNGGVEKAFVNYDGTARFGIVSISTAGITVIENTLTLNGGNGTSGNVTGYNLNLNGGAAYTSGNNNGGDVKIWGGTLNGSGMTGKIYIGTGSAGTNPLAGSGTGTSILLYNRSTGEITFGDK
jgi:hypothetical protein